MITSNIDLGDNVSINPTASINNVKIGSETKISGNSKVFGSPANSLEVGKGCYVGPYSTIEGFNAKVTIGDYVSIAQNVNLMSGSGPNASVKLQKIFPVTTGEVNIGDNAWIGASAIIMPNVTLGRFCIVAAHSYVNKSFPDYSIIGGVPAKLIRRFTDLEIEKVNS